jgi:hypothetical protein
MYVYDYISIDYFQHEKRTHKSCRENQNTHFVFNNIFFKSRRLCDNKKNMKQTERPQMTM